MEPIDLQINGYGIFVLGTFGLFGNTNIVLATWKRKELRNKYGLFIAILAFLQTLCVLGEMMNAYRQLNGIMMTKRPCFLSMLPYLFAMNAQPALMLGLGVDLLIGVAAPITFIPLMSRRSYMIGWLLLAAALPLSLIVASAFFLKDEPIPLCNPPLAFPEEVFPYWHYTAFGLGWPQVACYATAYSILRCRMQKGKTRVMNLHKHTRVMKSMLVVVLSFMCTIFLTANVTFTVVTFELPGLWRRIGLNYMVLPAMVGYSWNYYMLYWRNPEYRAVFNSQLRWLLCRKETRKDSQVTNVFHIRSTPTANRSTSHGHMPF